MDKMSQKTILNTYSRETPSPDKNQTLYNEIFYIMHIP
jgi:hypothetical protein